MSEARAVNPLVAQFQKPGVPRDLRLMAAQGALPPQAVRPPGAAPHPAVGRGPADPRHLVGDARRVPGRGAAAHLPRQGLAARRAGLDRHQPDGARAARGRAAERQPRGRGHRRRWPRRCPRSWRSWWSSTRRGLLRRTTLLVALEANPHLNNDQKRRLRELRETFQHRRGRSADHAPPPPSPPPPAEAVEEQAPGEDTLQSLPDAPLTESDAIVRYLTEEERNETDKISAVQRHLPAQHRREDHHRAQGLARGARRPGARPQPPGGRGGAGQPAPDRGGDRAVLRNEEPVRTRCCGRSAATREWTKRYGVVANLVAQPQTRRRHLRWARLAPERPRHQEPHRGPQRARSRSASTRRSSSKGPDTKKH